VRGARFGAAAGSRQLGLGVFELSLGTRDLPSHAHFGSEEVLVVLSGRPTLRTPNPRARARRGRGRGVPRRPRRSPPADQRERGPGPVPDGEHAGAGGCHRIPRLVARQRPGASGAARTPPPTSSRPRSSSATSTASRT